MSYPYSVTPGQISSLWEAISSLRKARGDAAGSLRAKQSAYAMRLGRAVIHDDREKRVAAINRVKSPEGVADPTREVREMAKTTAKTDTAGLVIEFAFERETKNTYRYAEVDSGHGAMVGTLYLHKSASLVMGKMPEKITVTITPGA